MINIPTSTAKEIFKKTLIKHGYNTIHNKVNNAINDIASSTITTATEPLTSTINAINNAPQTILTELKRQQYHESTANIFTYDYFTNYYNSFNTRYNATQQQNLAEILAIQEQHNKKLHGY